MVARQNKQSQLFQGNRAEIDEKVEEYMNDLDGEVVCVSVSSLCFIRAGFHTQMCIRGTLERHPETRSHYRLYKGEGEYCYFENSDIIGLSGHDTGDPIIHITIDQITDPMELAAKVLDSMDNA